MKTRRKGVILMAGRLGVGIVGCGFMAEFHVQSWQGVRGADIVALLSRSRESAERLAALCRRLGVGEPEVHTDLAAMLGTQGLDAVWICVPNDARIPVIETVAGEVESGRSGIRAVAVEKPLARTIEEALQVREMIDGAGLLHGYLENQVFAPAVTRGKEIIWRRGAANTGTPYLARAAEEHGGPHRSWFWIGPRQGGGALCDMMCHSIEACRYLLSDPGGEEDLVPVAVTASVAALKWSRPGYAARLREKYGPKVDYTTSPAEDYASAEVVFERGTGELVIAQTNTSWSFSGPGLRLSIELLGPEYSLDFNSLETGSRLFFSRDVSGSAGEDLVEKQAAEQGQMPFLADEAFAYGYTAENRHMVRAFREGEAPRETLDDGLLVTQLIACAYRSAELGRTVKFDPQGLIGYRPPVAEGRWEPTSLKDRAQDVKP